MKWHNGLLVFASHVIVNFGLQRGIFIFLKNRHQSVTLRQKGPNGAPRRESTHKKHTDRHYYFPFFLFHQQVSFSLSKQFVPRYHNTFRLQQFGFSKIIQIHGHMLFQKMNYYLSKRCIFHICFLYRGSQKQTIQVLSIMN